MNDEDESNLYRANLAYEIPGFYTDDDDILEGQHFAYSIHEEPHVSTTYADKQPSYTGRKRGWTNSFTGGPPHKSANPAAEGNNVHSSAMIPDLGQKTISKTSYATPLKSCSNEPRRAQEPKTSLATQNDVNTHLSLARRILMAKSTGMSITLGHQPIRTTMTPREQNDFSQKILLHQMNRSIPSQRAGLTLEVIPEEVG